MTRTHILLATVLAAMSGCDAKANSSDQGGSGKAQQSREYESCSSSRQCGAGLRCADMVCRSERTSILGDFHAAAAEVALEDNDNKRAIAQYTEAVNQYKAADLEVPLALYCAQGHALTLERKNAEYADLAARVLHRCALGTPNGSALRTRALEDLALLLEVGLDPLLLAQEPGDHYMTKKPMRPERDDVKVKAVSSISTSSRSYDAWITELQSPATREKLLPCWDKYSEDSGESTLSVTLDFKHRFVQGIYEEQDGYKLSVGDAPAAGDPATVAAAACVHGVIEPMAKEFRGGSGRWDGDITITLGPDA